ncbi:MULTISPECIES: right-handed parallel beta-helix repeat-containing protein [unclassified Rhizobium]|uniref:right-handed parallel beta-helix repeat-containing protein n=1 Tax=unclassified Rhizobium TaxID=2613769 RepID=UPI0007EAE4A5|nr:MULTISPECIES: right-handed parallel beta-helix repeat-containing protein [unclassified Rhizobium]ANK85545.1 serralysin-like metalloprotease/pectin lyase fold domain-containing protein [Rhizobium sp. N731]ANL15792.1 serralysin-like metalloprotease/pectin lyase fold domain-containing protein [Rhizobium sp. N1314]
MTTYYVASSSSGGGNGSASSPFRTISEAMASNLKPGDEVVVKPGTYNESINIDKDGSAAADITLRSEVPGGALIRPPAGSWNAITVNANHVVVDGFDISGASGDGIEASGVHHVQILNNKVHGNGESGIQFNQSDFIHVEGNETYNNASSGWFSGISLYENRNITGDTSTDGYRNIVRNNISHDNVTKSGEHTDGNGIIIDDFQSTQASGNPNYTFKTLVDNNLVYGNGGKGIQVTWSDSVTVKNNTAYHNNQDPQNTGTWRGELSNSASSNNTWVNNVAVADPSLNKNNTAIDNTSTDAYTNKNVVWANNITYNGTAGQASVKTDGGNAMPSSADGNKLGVDPKFVGASSDDFHLGSGSAAVDSGTTKYGVSSVDLDGDARVVGTVDMGAYESGSAPASGTPTAPTQPTTPTTGTPTTETPTTETPTTGTPTTGTPTTGTPTTGTPTTPTTETPTTGTPTTTTKLYTGTNGNDIMPHTGQSNGGNETFKGLAGNDMLKGGAGADVLDGGNGNDTASYAGSSAGVHVDLATKVASGGDATGDKLVSIENVTGSSYDDVLTGGNNGGNVLNGGAGADKLNGGAGADVIIGGAGKDIMTGGTSADTFAFKTATETGSGSNRDVITDFQHGVDKIDLSAIDANGSAQGDAAFHFQAQENALFDKKAGALAWHYEDDHTVIQADLNGDGVHDFEIQLQGHVQLGAGDFLL